MGEKKHMIKKIVKIILKAASFLLVTVLMVVIGVLGVIFVLEKGPSPTAKKLFVLSVRETSAIGFLANLYLTDEEVAALTVSEDIIIPVDNTDPSLIDIPTPTPSNGPDEGNDDPEEDGGIEILRLQGALYEGVMMIVKDPTRVFVGLTTDLGVKGQYLADMVKDNDAIAGINAGGFVDSIGGGQEGTPAGIVIQDGKLTWGESNVIYQVTGFDINGILHVGMMTPEEALEKKMQCAVSFGPPLIINGVVQNFESDLISGLNPRTAIGQRSDGAVLMLVIDGRRMDSLGASYQDIADIMLEYGAVNASNLDGGSSTLMIYEGEVLNVCASVTGPRLMPTSFLVR